MLRHAPASPSHPYGHLEQVDGDTVLLFDLNLRPLDPPSRPLTAAELDARRARAEADTAETELRELRAEVRAVKDALKAEQDRVQEVIDAPNSDINAKPAPYIVAVARAVKRSNRAVVALSRLVG